MRPSTKAVMDEAKANDKSMLSAMHGWVYGRWTWQYIWTLMNIRLRFAGEGGRDKWANHYHAKTLTLDQAESIINIDHDIPLRDLEQVIPYATAREFVLRSPTDVVLYECPCRRASGGQECSPTQVCMVIGKPFTDFILDKHPDISRRVSTEEALRVLREEHERGHIHTAWFKDAMLDRFYGLCNCCKCHCQGIKGMMAYGMNQIAPSGYSAQVNEQACTSCGKCADICPFGAIVAEGKTVVYDPRRCMGCEACVELCPKGARRMVRDESKGLPLDVREMDQEVIQQPIRQF